MIALFTLPLAPAQAAPATRSPVEAAFGNTIVSTYPSGRSTKLWLNRNGTYEGQRTNGKRTAGKWTLKGGKVCLRQTRPTGIPLTFCSTVPNGRVGATWTSKSPKGEPLRNRLVAGRG
ncbi:hypothetical protein GVN21_13180 [Caulobacter sp. SLTY]|uniref:hypothetical protein n=1 Tax=Caulobacter sp. SLTY TaxID=2683262 RepID=UPI00141260A8|nr:hypothetical protein [Caulobacter sp. SLTY]NBB16313.1 hypothetical protein [Caulobacter sp. SLTY]